MVDIRFNTPKLSPKSSKILIRLTAVSQRDSAAAAAAGYCVRTYEFGESLGDLAQSKDGLGTDDQWLRFILNDALDGNEQLLGAQVAHRLEYKHLVLLGLRLFQQAHQLLSQSQSHSHILD